MEFAILTLAPLAEIAKASANSLAPVTRTMWLKWELRVRFARAVRSFAMATRMSRIDARGIAPLQGVSGVWPGTAVTVAGSLNN